MNDYYREQLATHGPTPQGVGWGSAGSQAERFRALDEVFLPGTRGSVLDVGCGYGAYLAHLYKYSWGVTRYTGIDCEPAMIEAARLVHPLDVDRFRVADLLDPAFKGHWDYVVCSGAFNVKDGDNYSHAWRAVERMWELCTRGIAITFTSNHAPQDPHIFGYDPGYVLRFLPYDARRRWRLDHGYRPNDFCLLAWKG